MMDNLKNEKPIIKFFVLTSILILSIIIIFTPMIVMEKLIITKFELTLLPYIIIRTLEILYLCSLFIFGAYGGYTTFKRLI